MLDAYMEQFDRILSQGQFSEEAVIHMAAGGHPVTISGVFASGTYGMRSEASYVRDKQVVKHSFTFPLSSWPHATSLLARAKVEVRGGQYTATGQVLGGKSGVLTLELSEGWK